jgi:hypothetical protein
MLKSQMMFSAAAERNYSFIVNTVKEYYHILQSHLGTNQDEQRDPLHLLEIASGSGQHAAYLSEALPQLVIQPSDQGETKLTSINQYRSQVLKISPHSQINHAMLIDVKIPPQLWPIQKTNMILCVNMIHISPWECTEALLAAAQHLLAPYHYLILYGPYRFPNKPLALSNQNFDQSLRSRNPQWGIRDLNQIDHSAENHDLYRIDTITCPANNHILIYQSIPTT